MQHMRDPAGLPRLGSRAVSVSGACTRYRADVATAALGERGRHGARFVAGTSVPAPSPALSIAAIRTDKSSGDPVEKRGCGLLGERLGLQLIVAFHAEFE